jgi:CDP-diacylglycerol---glycerol-3-phosphate 3-phosphatidyltransferase
MLRTLRSETFCWAPPVEGGMKIDRRFITAANAISTYRIAAGPACAALLVRPGATSLYIALALMALAEVSDLFDGYVARATGHVSASGKILDPMADALYRGTVFVAFMLNGWMPLPILLLILTRDIVVANLRELAESQVGTLGARTSGKWKAISQGAAQLTIVSLAAAGVGQNQVWLFHLILIPAAVVTLYSLFDYSISTLRRSG